MLALVACSSPSGQNTSGSQLLVAAPNRARQGDTFALKGQGWQPDSQVTLAFDVSGRQNNFATSLGNTKADAQGHFTFVSVVPRAAEPGVWSITAHGASSQSARASFTVLDGGDTTSKLSVKVTTTGTSVPTSVPATSTPRPPAATPAPVVATKSPQQDLSFNVVWQGNNLHLTGSGWPANEEIKVSASKDSDGKGAVRLGVLGTDDQGQFDVSAKVPKGVKPNWYIILQDASHQVVAQIVGDGGDNNNGD
jgi:hypothetical protein